MRIVSAILFAAVLSCGGDADAGFAEFARDVAECRPSEFTVSQGAGASGVYAVEGPEGDLCRVSFEYTRNPNPDLVGRSVSFVVDRERPIEEQVRQGLATCLEGGVGEYRCEGALAANATNVTENRAAGGELPCGIEAESSGEPLYPMPRDGSWGYVDAEGEWMIEPQWDRAKSFHEGRAVVALHGGWGVIDREGDYVLQPRLQSQSFSNVDGVRIGISPLSPFSEGCAAGLGNAADQPPFFVDRDGTIHWESQPPEAFADLDVREFGSFSEGLAWFRAYDSDSGSAFGWINPKGEIVIEPEFAGAGRFEGGLAPAGSDRDNWGFIDPTGQLVLPGKWTLDHARPFSDGRAFASFGGFDQGYMNREGDSFEEVTFEDGRNGSIRMAGDFSEGYAAILTGTELVYINTDGTVVMVPNDTEGIHVCDGRSLPPFRNGLVQLLVADEGTDCGDDVNWLGLPDYSASHYVYLNPEGEVVLTQ